MEGMKPTSSSSMVVSDLFGAKESAASAKSSSAGTFSTLFPPPSSVVGKDSSESDLLRTLRKQENQIWKAQSATADGISQSNPNHGQSKPKQDWNSSYQNDTIDPCFLSSSIYYGGQDICTNSSSTQTTGVPYSLKKDGQDDLGNSDIASRGNWWQGSLYY